MQKILAILTIACASRAAAAGPGDRFAHLDERSPFYVHAGFPRLTTPMWFGEPDVDAVVILSIDDMTDPGKYQLYLAPILERLRAIEGRTPLSIFTNRVDPTDPRLQAWLRDGVRLDVHTRTHPCPLLRASLDDAVSEVFECLSNIDRIPGGRPAAFRMPCCDSINSASPRFFSEILPRLSAEGSFLEADSSVILFLDDDSRAYAPFANYAATIQGYPYPYVVAKDVWELPIVAPTDWQAQKRRGPFHPATVADIEANIDRVVQAQGTFTFCFHPHGWIRNDQVVAIIEHVAAKHGRRVRFLNFHDAIERLNRNLLGGTPLRAPDGGDNGVRLLDLNNDGFLDVVIGNDVRRETRVWDPGESCWRQGSFPFRIVARGVDRTVLETGVRFGVLGPGERPAALVASAEERGFASFDGREWVLAKRSPLDGIEVAGRPLLTSIAGRDRGVRLRDLDGDGWSELLVSNEAQNAAFGWDARASSFVEQPSFALPSRASIAGAEGEWRGLIFADLDADGLDDVVLSNDEEYYVYLCEETGRGWSRRVLHGAAGAPGALPRLAERGADLGGWVKDRVLYVANERTAARPDLVEVRRFDRMLEHMATPPVPPAEALKLFQAPPGFQVELFAAEPLVTDPVALEFGPDGRVWVVEMGNYPTGEGPGDPKIRGRVKLLRDSDGDGRADEVTLFADGLSFPTGVLAHGRGVLVTCAPDILYLEDADGDGRADLRQTIFTGFGEGNQQHRVNGLHFGIDNWIHGANGDSGGTILLPDQPGHAPVRIGGRDFRFTRDLRRFEAETGRSQFGLTFDCFGNRFGSSNARHLMHYLLPDRYLARNPHSAPPDPVVDIPDHGAMSRIFPISKLLLSLNTIHVPGHFSSACGVTVYQGDVFPDEYRGNAFVCEPVGNVVHRDILVPDGATFRAGRGEPDREFLASSDSWFRPVYATTGPDGALYVADMYRYVIEHPAYVPEEIQQILDFTAGRDLGRIYRIAHGSPGKGRAMSLHHDLTREPTETLVGLLASENGWTRAAVQRILVESSDPAALEPLRTLFGAATRPEVRLHALWTLEGSSLLADDLVLRALEDPHEAVREHALRLAEPRLERSAALLGAALARASDASFRVRLQAALSLGEVAGLEAAEGLAGLLRRDVDDPWMRAAVLSSASRHAGHLLAWCFSGPGAPPSSSRAWRSVFEGLMRTVVRGGNLAQVQDVLERISGPADVKRWHFLLVAEAERAGAPPAARSPAWNVIASRALEVVEDDRSDPDERAEAAAALGTTIEGDLARRLLRPQEPLEVQLAAVKALGSAAAAGSPAAARTLLGAWVGLGPTARSETLEALLATPEGARSLLDSLEEALVSAPEIDAASRSRLLAFPGLRERAARLLPGAARGDRELVVRQYAGALRGLARNAGRGRAVFLQACAHCHRLEGEGSEVGPDLAEARAKGESSLLEAILNPGRMVPPRYAPYVVETASGGVATGLISNETAASLTLLRAGGVSETLLRKDLVRISPAGGSMMPADLEKTFSPADIGDLLGFLAALPLPLSRVTPESAAAARREVLASGHNGISEVIRWLGREEQASWLGRASMPYTRQLDGNGELEWRTEPVPGDLPPTARQRFRFPAAMGYRSQPAGSFTLYLGGRKLVDFDVSLEARTWRSPDADFVLTFEPRAIDTEDATGLMTLEVPASILQPGKAVSLKVVGSASASRRWFGLLPLR